MLKELSAKGESRERLRVVVDFELFRKDLRGAAPCSERAAGICPRADVKTLVLQASSIVTGSHEVVRAE